MVERGCNNILSVVPGSTIIQRFALKNQQMMHKKIASVLIACTTLAHVRYTDKMAGSIADHETLDPLVVAGQCDE